MDKLKVDGAHWKTLIETAGGSISKDAQEATIVIETEAPVRSSSRNTRLNSKTYSSDLIFNGILTQNLEFEKYKL